MNTLKSVFWDYPVYSDENTLQHSIQKCREEENIGMYKWFLRRLLEHGKSVDVFRYVSVEEIRAHLDDLQLTEYAARKWRRLVEVYGESV